MKQNPFSLYDVLGYIIPGIFVFITIEITFFFKFETVTNCDIKNIYIDEFPRLINRIDSIGVNSIILLLISSYIVGHLFSYGSSITIEKYLNWNYGYPSKYLLNIQDSMECSKDCSCSKKRKCSANKYFRKDDKLHIRIWKILLFILLLPTTLLDIILNFCGLRDFYAKPLDSTLISIIKTKTNILLKKLGEKEDDNQNSDFFRLIQHYTFENCKQHHSKFTNYVALYGFLRTITLIFNLLTWYFLIHTLGFSKFCTYKYFVLFALIISSYIFFMSFIKFYRRYTLEGLMVLAVDTELSDE